MGREGEMWEVREEWDVREVRRRWGMSGKCGGGERGVGGVEEEREVGEGVGGEGEVRERSGGECRSGRLLWRSGR